MIRITEGLEVEKQSKKARSQEMKQLSSARRKGYTVYGQPYREYIQSAEWRAVRERYWASRLDKSCYVCTAPRSPGMHLHHRTYKRLGAERLMDLVPVCDKCHRLIHKEHEQNPSSDLWYLTRRIAKEYQRRHALTPIPSSGVPRTLGRCPKCGNNVMSYQQWTDSPNKAKRYAHVDCSKVTFKSKKKKSR